MVARTPSALSVARGLHLSQLTEPEAMIATQKIAAVEDVQLRAVTSCKPAAVFDAAYQTTGRRLSRCT